MGDKSNKRNEGVDLMKDMPQSEAEELQRTLAKSDQQESSK